MLELWQGEDGGGSARNAVAARDSLRRPLTDNERQATAADDRSYSRTRKVKSASSSHGCRTPTW